MTREQVLALKGIELRRSVAHVMGWRDLEVVSELIFTEDGLNDHVYMTGREPETDHRLHVPAYEGACVGLVEEEIEQTGMQHLYIKALAWIVAGVEKLRDLDEDLFALVTAKPQDRCKAALLAVLFVEEVYLK